MAVYGQPKMLEFQCHVMSRWPADLRRRVSVIIVDDHGFPEAKLPAAFVGSMPHTEVWRIDDDIPWNQMGARNLGMYHAQGWCVMLDPDMVITTEMLERFFDAVEKAERRTVTRFGLYHMDRSQKKIDMTSPNTYLIHRDDFFEAGGYDEDYRGHKGWSDVQLLATLRTFFKMIPRNDLWVDFYGQDKISDAQVVTLDRSVRHNKAIHIRKRNEAKRGWIQWVNKRKGPNLRFKYHRSR